MLLNSLRVVLNLEASPKPSPAGMDATDTPGDDEAALSSARNIIAIVRKYRNQYGLRYAPFVFIYGVAKAFQIIAVSGIPEERAYLLHALDECSETWGLARTLKEHAGRTGANMGLFIV